MRFEDRSTSNTPEIEFTADVRMRELRFREVPNPEVSFPGYTESDWLSERENLPNEVQEDVVYRNSGIRLLIASETTRSNADFPRNSDKERVGTSLKDPDHPKRET